MRLEIDNRRRKISIKFYTLGFGILYASFWKIVTFRFTDYTYFWDAIAGRAVALNGRQPPRKVLEGIIRNAHLRLFASHLHRQITSRIALIGHAAA